MPVDAACACFDNALNLGAKQSIRLGPAQVTLLVPLYARALDSRGKRPILNDAKAVEMAQFIAWDFRRFKQRWRVVMGVLRSAMLDEWVKEFLVRHPEGSVVEIGAGCAVGRACRSALSRSVLIVDNEASKVQKNGQ